MAVQKADLEALMRTHQAGVWRYLRFLGCERALAEDLTQETFLAILDSDFTPVEDKATAAYLRNRARFLFLNSVRRKKIEINAREVMAADAIWEQRTAGGDIDGYLDAMKRCLESAEERTKQALEMRFGERAPVEEIAKTLGLQYAGVKTLLLRAKAWLKNCIERRLRAGSGTA
ncbi:MAG: sigma-70 family RNA polymerase sigma factor [Planctomycetaceae bacterium]|nr:sigma-70 family RNA polymerase sigma factor [Planctomycetaceae bacterium]